MKNQIEFHLFDSERLGYALKNNEQMDFGCFENPHLKCWKCQTHFRDSGFRVVAMGKCHHWRRRRVCHRRCHAPFDVFRTKFQDIKISILLPFRTKNNKDFF